MKGSRIFLGLLLFYKLYILLREIMIDHLITMVFAVRLSLMFGASGSRRKLTTHGIFSSRHRDGSNRRDIELCGKLLKNTEGWLHYNPLTEIQLTWITALNESVLVLLTTYSPIASS